jgi:hypothetical protein
MSPAFLNRPSRAAALLAACLGLAASLPALAEWRDIPYAEVAKMPLTLAKVDPQKIFTVRLAALPGKGHTELPSDFKLQLKVGGKVLPVTVSPDGRIELPFRQDWADAGAMLQTNQPKGRVAVDLRFASRVPAGTRMSYAQLTEAAPVLEKGIDEMAGMMSFLAPEVRHFTLSFAQPPQSLLLTLPNGKKHSYKTDAKGQIVLPWEPKWAAGTVELSAPLKGIDQTLK